MFELEYWCDKKEDWRVDVRGSLEDCLEDFFYYKAHGKKVRITWTPSQ